VQEGIQRAKGKNNILAVSPNSTATVRELLKKGKSA